MKLVRVFRPFVVPGEVFLSYGLPREPTQGLPLIRRSERLENLLGLENVDIMDHSLTDTHKWHKETKALEHADSNGIGVLAKISAGSGIDALRLASLYYADKQAVRIIPGADEFRLDVKKYVDHGLSPLEINLSVTANDFITPKDNQRLWSMIIGEEKPNKRFLKRFMGKNAMAIIDELRESAEVRLLLESLSARGIDPTKLLDTTNYTNYTNECPYRFDTKDMRGYDVIAGNIGSGERGRGEMDAVRGNTLWERITGRFRAKPKMVYVIPEGHPLDPNNQYKHSDAMKLMTPYWVDALKAIKRNADENVHFLPASMQAIDYAHGIMKGVIAYEHPEMRSEFTGSSSLAAFMPPHYNRQTMTIEGTVQYLANESNPWAKKAREGNLELKPGMRLLVINTGESRDIARKVCESSLPYNKMAFTRADEYKTKAA